MFEEAFDAVDTLFFKEDVYIDVFQHSNIFEAVNGVSGKPADGFGNDHVDPTALAHADHLVEFIAVFGARS